MRTDIDTIIAIVAELCGVEFEAELRYILALLRGIVVRG